MSFVQKHKTFLSLLLTLILQVITALNAGTQSRIVDFLWKQQILLRKKSALSVLISGASGGLLLGPSVSQIIFLRIRKTLHINKRLLSGAAPRYSQFPPCSLLSTQALAEKAPQVKVILAELEPTIGSHPAVSSISQSGDLPSTAPLPSANGGLQYKVEVGETVLFLIV